MTIELTHMPNADARETSESVVGLQVIGTLEKSDLEVLGAQLDLQVDRHGTIRLLIERVDFKGMTSPRSLGG